MPQIRNRLPLGALLLLLALPLWRMQPTITPTTLTWTQLSTVAGQIPLPSNSTEQTAAMILDVDHNGVNDFVIGSRRNGTPSVVWYQRTPTGWTLHPIDNEILDLEAGGAGADIDGDGDLDIAIGGDQRSNMIWWWENPQPNFDSTTGWTRREIKHSGSVKHHDLIFADVDGDGALELIFWNQQAKTLFLAEIPPDPHTNQPWSLRPIYSWSDTIQEEGLALADIDGDSQVDIIGGGKWFKYNVDGSFTPHFIDLNLRFSRAAVGQLVAGGWPEVVLAAGDTAGSIKWYQWNGSTWVGQPLLAFNIDRGHSLAVADFDLDSHLDIFAAEMRVDGENSDAGAWIWLGDSQGGFTRTTVAVGFDHHESKVADLDGDGDVDILGKPYNYGTPRLDIWLNLRNDPPTPTPSASPSGTPCPNPAFAWQRHVLDQNAPWRTIFIDAADLDGDGLPEVITGGWWYKNPGQAGSSWLRNSLGAPLNQLAAVYDFDGDGDSDVLGTHAQGSDPNSTFAWARNDGAGTFTIFPTVTVANGTFLQGVAVDRLGSNEDLAVALSWHSSNQGLQRLSLPGNPATEPWPWQQISPVSQHEALSTGDIDRDGDSDLLLGTQWLRNDEATGAGWTPYTLFATAEEADRNRLVDMNGDGRLDAVIGYEAANVPGKVAWYEQPPIATDPWIEHLVIDLIGPMSLDVADLDDDGDLDLVVGEHNTRQPAAARIFVLENLAGLGGRWRAHLVHTGDEHHDGARVVDIDGDGDLDILSIGWTHRRVLLYENVTEPCNLSPPTVTPAPTESTTPTPTGTPVRNGVLAGLVFLLVDDVRQPIQTELGIVLTDQTGAQPTQRFQVQTTNVGAYQVSAVPAGAYHLTLHPAGQYQPPEPLAVTVQPEAIVYLEHTLQRRAVYTTYVPLVLE